MSTTYLLVGAVIVAAWLFDRRQLRRRVKSLEAARASESVRVAAIESTVVNLYYELREARAAQWDELRWYHLSDITREAANRPGRSGARRE